MRALLTVLVLAAAVVAAGCGGGSDTSADTSGGTGTVSAATPASDWANSVCEAFTSWQSSITEAGKSVGENPSEEGIKDAGDQIQSATQTLADDLRGLGRPDTEGGQQAKDAIDELATSLEASLQKIQEATDNASGTAGAVAAATAIGNNLVDMGNQVSTASQKLEDIDAQGELKDAFANADSCAGLTGTS
jgi:phage-related protein